MAIQNRRGIFSDLDPTKLLPGEYAVVISGDPDNTDGNGVYICFAPGQVKKIALTEDTSLDGKVYPELTAGDIFADTYAENKIPYFFRPSGGGSEVGTIEAPVLVGGSIGYNQLVRNGNFADDSRWSLVRATKAVSGNVLTATCDGTGFVSAVNALSGQVNHKHLILFDIKVSNTAMKMSGSLSINSINTDNFASGVTFESANTWYSMGYISVPTNDASAFRVGMADASANDTFSIRKVMVIDLTLLLGSTIADRIYTLEQSTAGSGIAQLRAWGFDFSEYIPYSAPTLKHVEGVSAHKFVGFNQWDEEWELGSLDTSTGEPTYDPAKIRSKNFCPCIPSTTYYLTSSNIASYVWFYDADKNFVSFLTATTREWATPNNAHYFKVRVGDASHPQTTYHNDICINISNSSKNGTYEPYRTWSYALDSTLTLRGVPKLDANNQLYFDGDTYEPDGTVTRNCAVRAYQSGDESLADAITDGTNTVYKLSTPTTEQATPFTQYQEVDANGTEEYVSTGVVPVGHDTKYPTDLKGTFESILSAIPSANGTYALKVTVNNGKKTFSWV